MPFEVVSWVGRGIGVVIVEGKRQVTFGRRIITSGDSVE